MRIIFQIMWHLLRNAWQHMDIFMTSLFLFNSISSFYLLNLLKSNISQKFTNMCSINQIYRVESTYTTYSTYWTLAYLKYEQFEFVYCIFSCQFATCCIHFAFVRGSIEAVTYLLTRSKYIYITTVWYSFYHHHHIFWKSLFLLLGAR